MCTKACFLYPFLCSWAPRLLPHVTTVNRSPRRQMFKCLCDVLAWIPAHVGDSAGFLGGVHSSRCSSPTAPLCPHPHQHLLLLSFASLVTSFRLDWDESQCNFNMHFFLMEGRVERFHNLLAISTSFCEKRVHFITHLAIGFDLLLFSFLSYFYMWDFNPLLDIYLAKFSPFCRLHPANCSFVMQSF